VGQAPVLDWEHPHWLTSSPFETVCKKNAEVPVTLALHAAMHSAAVYRLLTS